MTAPLPRVGDIVPVTFRSTKVPPATAEVLEVDGRLLTVRYLDGQFAGLQGLIRLPGWSTPQPAPGAEQLRQDLERTDDDDPPPLTALDFPCPTCLELAGRPCKRGDGLPHWPRSQGPRLQGTPLPVHRARERTLAEWQRRRHVKGTP